MRDFVDVKVNVFKSDGTLIPFLVRITNAVDEWDALKKAREYATKQFPGHHIGACTSATTIVAGEDAPVIDAGAA